jgi:hypothetical protein
MLVKGWIYGGLRALISCAGSDVNGLIKMKSQKVTKA